MIPIRSRIRTLKSHFTDHFENRELAFWVLGWLDKPHQHSGWTSVRDALPKSWAQYNIRNPRQSGYDAGYEDGQAGKPHYYRDCDYGDPYELERVSYHAKPWPMEEKL